MGEEIGSIDNVRIVANSDLDLADIEAAKAVRDAKLFRRFVEGETVLDAALTRKVFIRRDSIRRGSRRIS